MTIIKKSWSFKRIRGEKYSESFILLPSYILLGLPIAKSKKKVESKSPVIEAIETVLMRQKAGEEGPRPRPE